MAGMSCYERNCVHHREVERGVPAPPSGIFYQKTIESRRRMENAFPVFRIVKSITSGQRYMAHLFWLKTISRITRRHAQLSRAIWTGN